MRKPRRDLALLLQGFLPERSAFLVVGRRNPASGKLFDWLYGRLIIYGAVVQSALKRRHG